ncbi:MAG: response regulator [Alphaproteobacteria bacterium]
MIGSTCTIVGNGQEALDILANQKFDVVLMDMRMPVMDGLEATRRLRTREEAEGKPPALVVALTANAMADDMEACRTAGMNDFMTKPLTFEKFYKGLEKLNLCGAAPVEEVQPEVESDKFGGMMIGGEAQPSVVFDKEFLETASGGDVEFQAQLLKIYKEETAKLVDILEASAPGAEEWRAAAHRLKGSSLNLGFNQLSQICGDAEKATDPNTQSQHREAIHQGLTRAFLAAGNAS